MTTALTTDQIRSALGRSSWKHDFLRESSTRDLLDRLESWQYTRLDSINHQGTCDYCELRIDEIRTELTRRRKILARAQADDAYAPKWPSREERTQRLEQRKQAIKSQWPMDRFCTDVLFCDLKPMGRGEFICQCPFPDHDDSSPSFRVYPNDSAYCFGCHRGGDILTIAEIYFRLDRFVDVLETIEALSGVGRVA